jgi:ParB family chromosome partitioning protein
MSAQKKNPFLKKAAGAKPPTRREMKRGLGRGLNALISPSASTSAQMPEKMDPKTLSVPPVPPPPSRPAGDAVVNVPPLELERSPWQPRTEFKEETLRELADSIKANGVIQPVVCRRRADGKLELICGERRLRACLLAGVKTIPAIVKNVDDRTAATMNVTENAQRDDLNPIDEAEGYRRLQDEFGLTQADVAEQVGKSRSAIANSTRLLELPDDVQDLLRKNAITTGHAKVLLSLDNPVQIRRLAVECVPVTDLKTGRTSGGLTVRELERRIARLSAPVVERKTGKPDIPESYLRSLVDELHKTLGCAVRLTSGVTHANGKHTKGVLEIDFVDNDDLDRILAMIGVKMD